MNPFDRTFHPDEANQAFTVGHLLETGVYTYKPTDHHGPTLYYAAAPIQHFTGHTNTATIDPTLLRATPLLFAILTLVFTALAVFRVVRQPKRLRALNEAVPPPDWMLPWAAILLLGTAPLFVFFATDFIQEMLLTCFLMLMYWSATGFLGALFSPGTVPSAPTPRALFPFKPGTWMILFGAFAGLAFATKETCVISFGAAGIAALPFLPGIVRHFRDHGWPKRLASHFVLGALAFAIVSAILYSSFGQNWQGVKDAFITAPLSYLHRAAGDAVSEGAAWHVHPWWQYFAWLFHYAPFEETLLFTFPLLCVPGLLCLAKFLQAKSNPTVLFARAAGTVPAQRTGPSSITRPGSAPQPTGTVPPRPTAFGAYRFTLLYSIVLMAIYALIPYKTPWCALQFLPGLVLATVFGIHVLQERLPLPRAGHILGCLAIVAAIVACRVPALKIVWNEPDSSKIPFNYANASPEVQDLARDVAQALQAKRVRIAPADPSATRGQSPHEGAFVAVALPATDTWPFPFYNRANEDRTGYWTSLDDLLKLKESGIQPIAVLVPLSEGHLAQAYFPTLSHTRRYYIRPGVRVRLFW